MYPKQLLPLTGAETMLQQTVRRLEGVRETSNDCVVICNEAHRIAVQCGDYLGEDDIVRLEDDYWREGTNTRLDKP